MHRIWSFPEGSGLPTESFNLLRWHPAEGEGGRQLAKPKGGSRSKLRCCVFFCGWLLFFKPSYRYYNIHPTPSSTTCRTVLCGLPFLCCLPFSTSYSTIIYTNIIHIIHSSTGKANKNNGLLKIWSRSRLWKHPRCATETATEKVVCVSFGGSN